jgi:hypothetical protein
MLCCQVDRLPVATSGVIVTEPDPGMAAEHPLAEAARLAARSARARADAVAAQRAALRGHHLADVGQAVEALTWQEQARGRLHASQRRLLTMRLARAHRAVGQDVVAVARRLARLTLADDVVREPLADPDDEGWDAFPE